MKTYLQSKVKYIKMVKAVVASLLGAMILIDIVLVALDKKGYPTFSWVVRDNRAHLIWLTFLYGGLIAKIFYNRKVQIKESEATGFLTFATIVLLLYFLGHLIDVKVGPPYQLLILLSGGILAYRAWPQYTP